jgi:predicted transcriptional regulator
MTQKELARTLKLSEAFVCYALKGKRNSKRAEMVRKTYADALMRRADKLRAASNVANN